MSPGRWLLVLWLAGFASLPAREYALRFTDEAGRPVEGVAVRALLMPEDDPRAAGMEELRIVTKTDGFFRCGGRGAMTLLELHGERAGFYPIDLGASARRVLPGSDSPPVWLLTMPRRIKPIPLHALKPWLAQGNGRFRRDEWIAYDLRVGSPLPPFGQGQVEDFRFRVTAKMTGWNASRAYIEEQRRMAPAKHWDEETVRDVYGVWQAELTLAFPHPQAGILRSSRFWPYARLKMPHEAPTDAYQAEYKATYMSDGQAGEGEDELGYWLRTRVKVDAAGKIVGAHYAKIVGGLRFTQATLGFAYYFNPTPLDRNLEFDPKKNLLKPPPGAAGAEVGSYQVSEP